MTARRFSARALLALVLLPCSLAFAAGLRGSRASMIKQHSIAVKESFTFLRNASQLRDLAEQARLVTVLSSRDMLVTEGVSFAYTRPIVKLFLDRLAAQYHVAMGERLVVTSLTRPINDQPRNASPLSVHPAGMAVDLRVPSSAVERAWLEQTLLSLEDRGVLDVTREHRPSHYHVAVFPDQYASYLAQLGVDTTSTAAAVEAQTEAANAPAAMAVSSAAVTGDVDVATTGLPFFVVSAAAYLLAVLVAGIGTLRRARR